MRGYKSLESIHGIKSEWLTDAPTLRSVKDHIEEICGKVLISDSNFNSSADSNQNELIEISRYEPINS